MDETLEPHVEHETELEDERFEDDGGHVNPYDPPS
jgi:hypothetical protein